MVNKYIIEIKGRDIIIKSNEIKFSTYENGEQTSLFAFNPKYDKIIDRANDYCIEIREKFLELEKLIHDNK